MNVLVGSGPLREATQQWVATLEAALPTALSRRDARTLIREIFAAFLLLRWLEHAEAEQEAMAVFEGRTYRALLPPALRWRQWAQLRDARVMAEPLGELAQRLEILRGDDAHPVIAWLHLLGPPLQRALQVSGVYLLDWMRWVAELPFETPGDRRALLDAFDFVIDETSDPYDGQYRTPLNIARLMAALVNPQPSERVYDPCFGSANLLVAAWQQAERGRHDPRRSGALLEVAGVEVNGGAFLIGLTRMVLAGIDSPHVQLGDSLERESPRSPRRQGFDVVLANPPIAARTNRERWGYQHFAILTTDATGLFVQHALAQLKPNGRAVVAVPEGFLFRGGAERELRRQLLEQGQVEAVVSLPAGVFLPYTAVKSSLLLLRRQGGLGRVRMVDTAPVFNTRPDSKTAVIGMEAALQLTAELGRLELQSPREMTARGPESKPGIGVWDVSVAELAAVDWDLTARRRERGGLNELLASLKDVLGESGAVVPLSSIATVMAGRAIKSAYLLDEPVDEQALGYVRIKDLSQGKVGRPSRWLSSDLAKVERRWALLAGDVLVSKSGTIGKVALVRNGAVGALAANGLYVVRADQKRLDAGFLLAYLANPACQNWLTAQSRGTAIQHLNRAVLNAMPVPLPPLTLQARAAEQFREFGIDALAFLAQFTGEAESDRLSPWLAELNSKVPIFTPGLDETPTLGLFESVVALAGAARGWLEREQVDSLSARWLRPLVDALILLAGVSQIPRGPSLLSVLQDAERKVEVMLDQSTGQLPIESQARAIAERLRDWLRAASRGLTQSVELRVHRAPAALPAGNFVEFAIELENAGPLPLLSVRVQSSPDWGTADAAYLTEQGSLRFALQGDIPKQASQLVLLLNWQARTLTGQAVSGELEWAVRVTAPELAATQLTAELGGSPYVTGSPLEPHHGHNVFFGREELIAQISRQIASHGNVVLLEGNRRGGKTSILRHLEGRVAIPGWLAVYSSLQGAEGAPQVMGVPTAEVFREIARCIAVALIGLAMDVPLPNGRVICAGKPALGVAQASREGIGESAPFTDFRDYLEVILRALEPLRLGLVLMLDEFDKLQEGIDSGVTSPQVPENIRFLIQTYPKFSAILTGSRRLKRLREEYWSALYGLGTSIPVTALDIDSARSVVVEPVRDRLTFSREAIDRVIEVTARQPYLMQCLCNRVFDYAVQTKIRSITLSVINEAAQSLVRDNEHFATLWDYAALGPSSGRQRRQMILLLSALSFKQGTHISFGTLQEQLAQAGVDVDEEALDADLAYLRELELIEFSGHIGDGQYRLAIPLMADWIEQQHDADVVTRRARAEAEEEHARP